MAEMLQSRMEGVRFTSCDAVLAQARAVKSEWELEKLRRCGALHAKVLDEMLPERIHPGMSDLMLRERMWKRCSRAAEAECCG